jgi:uncharacterized membrane protein YfhO
MNKKIYIGMIAIGAIILLKPLVGIIRLLQYLAVSGTVSAVSISVDEQSVIVWKMSLLVSIILIIIGINGLRRKKTK